MAHGLRWCGAPVLPNATKVRGHELQVCVPHMIRDVSRVAAAALCPSCRVGAAHALHPRCWRSQLLAKPVPHVEPPRSLPPSAAVHHTQSQARRRKKAKLGQLAHAAGSVAEPGRLGRRASRADANDALWPELAGPVSPGQPDQASTSQASQAGLVKRGAFSVSCAQAQERKHY